MTPRRRGRAALYREFLQPGGVVLGWAVPVIPRRK